MVQGLPEMRQRPTRAELTLRTGALKDFTFAHPRSTLTYFIVLSYQAHTCMAGTNHIHLMPPADKYFIFIDMHPC